MRKTLENRTGRLQFLAGRQSAVPLYGRYLSGSIGLRSIPTRIAPWSGPQIDGGQLLVRVRRGMARVRPTISRMDRFTQPGNPNPADIALFRYTFPRLAPKPERTGSLDCR